VSLTSLAFVKENTQTMHRFSACLAVGAMLLALISAPLFHIHEHDDHGNPEVSVHAHFPQLASPWHHDTKEVESQHSADRARSIDVLTMNAPAAVFHPVAEISETLPLPRLEEQDSIGPIGSPRAHSPPYVRRAAPRSPPTL
jgi:hypothetical protein